MDLIQTHSKCKRVQLFENIYKEAPFQHVSQLRLYAHEFRSCE